MTPDEPEPKIIYVLTPYHCRYLDPFTDVSNEMQIPVFVVYCSTVLTAHQQVPAKQ